MSAARVRRKRKRSKPMNKVLKSNFKKAIDAAEHLRYQDGLQAVKAGEGKGKIKGQNSRCVLGSVAVDDDCNVKPYEQANRWDYAIGYDRKSQVVVHFVEVHSAHTSQVRKVEKKARWLKDFLNRRQQEELSKLPSEFHWLATNGMHIPKHTPQYKRLRLGLGAGVKFYGKNLVLS